MRDVILVEIMKHCDGQRAYFNEVRDVANVDLPHLIEGQSKVHLHHNRALSEDWDSGAHLKKSRMGLYRKNICKSTWHYVHK